MNTNMKILKHISAGVFLLVFAFACNDGIDPISAVPPGPDEIAPTVTIKNPTLSKIIIPFTDDSAPMNFEFDVSDDIEIQNITISLDGTELETYDNFKDYRRSVNAFRYEDLPIGDHIVEITATDISGKSTSQSFAFLLTNIYEPKFPGEIFYMPFEGDLYLDLLSKASATKVGTPQFAAGKRGKAYAGDAGAYLTFPTANLQLGGEFSATFWYKVNASPDRSGILTISPPDPDLPVTPNNRKNGFRFFREAGGSNQILKLNVGTGTAESWFDGGAAAALNPASADWVHVAFTISGTQAVVYFNGEVVSQGSFTGVDWTGCNVLSIASGAPRFIEWGHLSDQSLLDELRIYNKALTKEEIKLVMVD
jgi:hypothetical protein